MVVRFDLRLECFDETLHVGSLLLHGLEISSVRRRPRLLMGIVVAARVIVVIVRLVRRLAILTSAIGSVAGSGGRSTRGLPTEWGARLGAR